MTKKLSVCTCISAALSLLHTAPAHGATVGYVATACSVVARGTVTSWDEAATGVSFDITVQTVFKGTASLGTIHVSHMWNRGGMVLSESQIGTQTITAKIEGIWCLQQATSSGWDVMPINGPDGYFMNLSWPAAPALPAPYQIRSSALPDTLLFELAAGIESGRVNPETAIAAAQGAQGSSLQLVASRFMNSPIPEFRIAGLAGLLPIQPSAINSVSGLWPSISSNPRRFILLFAIRNTFRDPAPGSIQQLVQLTAVSPELREAAVHAISSIHTKESLPFLATLLTSPDASERAKGVFGLSSFANACPSQTPANTQSMAYLQCPDSAPYKTPETVTNFASPGTPSDQVVTFWINWWIRNQASLI